MLSVVFNADLGLLISHNLSGFTGGRCTGPGVPLAGYKYAHKNRCALHTGASVRSSKGEAE